MIKVTRGWLIEYGLSLPPLAISFEFNPETISRTRSMQITNGELPGSRGGYGFTTPFDTKRASQGVEPKLETFSIEILLDATDRMDQDDGVAATLGVQPEIDTLRSMIEPKIQGDGGLQILASLGAGGSRAFDHAEHASVLLFVWGLRILPVFITTLKIDEQAHLPSLWPYRAKVAISMQIIESDNPFYTAETVRQLIGAGLNLVSGTFSASVEIF